MGPFKFITCALVASAWLQTADAEDLIERLQQTRAVNIDAIIKEQFSVAKAARGFQVADPYAEPAAATVRRWQGSAAFENQFCAIRFTDAEQISYELKRFESSRAASEAGFTVTHQGRCGSCSTLRDLAVYLSTPDLTTPARHCARRIGLKGKKRCFEEDIGFTGRCAESWAYNAANTRDECLGACVADYGFFNLLLRRYPGSNVDASARTQKQRARQSPAADRNPAAG